MAVSDTDPRLERTSICRRQDIWDIHPLAYLVNDPLSLSWHPIIQIHRHILAPGLNVMRALNQGDGANDQYHRLGKTVLLSDLCRFSESI